MGFRKMKSFNKIEWRVFLFCSSEIMETEKNALMNYQGYVAFIFVLEVDKNYTCCKSKNMLQLLEEKVKEIRQICQLDS